MFGTADCSRMESLRQGNILDFCAFTVWFDQIQAWKKTFWWVPHAKWFLSILDRKPREA